MLTMRCLSNGGIKECAIPITLLQGLEPLAYKPSAYFDMDQQVDVEAICLRELVLKRMRTDGIRSAYTFMSEAANELRNKRAPISVVRHEDGLLLVEDGNSTVVVAAFSGWRDVPCVVENETAPESTTRTGNVQRP